ncbi:hypothetical protein ACTAF0_09060 [Streptomyces murinus]|uniref:hypothetical protein n=1 Tax=Streptomyces murinus TaxID=33900 RepID=UPI003F46AD28
MFVYTAASWSASPSGALRESWWTKARSCRSKKPIFWCVSDPDDVARVEDRTFICSKDETDAGPTNNWVDPVDMRTVMTEHYRGAMAGRTTYVIAFCMVLLDAEQPKFGVQITDSEYVAVSMQIMTRPPTAWKSSPTEPSSSPACTLVRAPLADGQADVAWPCDKTKYIAHFPGDRHHLELRFGLRRQRATGRSVSGATHRLGPGPRRGLAC